MRCASCGQENPDRAKFCLECGAAFALHCESCETGLPAGARFCLECGTAVSAGRPGVPDRDPRDYTPRHLADKMLRSKSALEGERKQVTVLFADVKGSLELAGSIDPEEWHRIMDRFFQILADGVHRFEGTINQYTGDGIMALFGAPIAHEDHAQRACYAALHLRDELEHYTREVKRESGLNFSVRMGLNSGEVVVGKIGDDLRMDYTAQGQTVGLAARMEELASPDTAYATEHTAGLVSGYFELEDLGRFPLKGVREPVGVHQLRGIGPLHTRLEVARARGLSRFVGRAAELGALEAALDHAIEGQGQVVGVVGEAGVGKSRLCFEFAERCRARGIMVREAHGVAHGKMIPFLPVLELMRGYFGISERDSDEMARDKIAGRLVRLDPDLAELLPLLFDVLGVPDPARPPPSMNPEARERQIFAFARKLVRARSEREPAILIMEDLHWIDGASDAFVENLVESLPGTRTLLVVDFRPEYRAEWMQKSYYQQLPLLPLGPEAIRELLENLLGRDPSLADLHQRICERTGGNPFFLEELVWSLAESGALVGEKGRYRLGKPIDQVTIAPTVQAVLSARIDRLQERDKQVLQHAAIIGKSFPESILKRIVEITDAELDAALRTLTRAEFLYEEALYPEAKYAFKHPLTQEVAYGSQLGDRRRRVHRAVAETLEEIHVEKLDEQAALLAHHWEGAGEPLIAAHWHRRAAIWAGPRHAAEAARHWRRVRTLLEGSRESPEILALGAEARGQIMLLSSRLGATDQEFDALFTEARELAARSGDLRTNVLTRFYYGYVNALSGRVPEALEAYREADCLADEAEGSDLKTLISCAQMSLLIPTAGECSQALPRLERAIESTRHHPQLVEEAFGYRVHGMLICWRGLAIGLMGRLEEGVREIDRATAIGREGQPMVTVGAQMSYLWMADLLGDPVAALARARQSVELAENMGLMGVCAELNLGLAWLLNEEWEEAARVLEQGLTTCRDRRVYRFIEPVYLQALSRAHLARGDFRSARASAEEAVALAGDRGCHGAHAYLALARVLLRSEGAPARREIESALAGAQRQIDSSGARSRQANLQELRAELARLLGDDASRERELREAHRLFTEMGATGHAERLAREIES